MLWSTQLLNNGGKDINCDWLRVLTGVLAAEETLLMHLADHFGGAGSHFVLCPLYFVLCTSLHDLLCFVLCPESARVCDDLCACIYSSPTNLCSAIAGAIKSSHLTIWTNQLFIHAVPSLDTAPRPVFPYWSGFFYIWLRINHFFARKKI